MFVRLDDRGDKAAAERVAFHLFVLDKPKVAVSPVNVARNL